METTYPHMLTLEIDQKQLGTYRAFSQEAVQEILSIHQSLNNTGCQFKLILNHLTKPDIFLKKFHELNQ